MDFYAQRKEYNETEADVKVEDKAENSNILNLADFLNQKDSVFDLFGDKTEEKPESVRQTEGSAVSLEDSDDIHQLTSDVEVVTPPSPLMTSISSVQVLSISSGPAPSQPTVTKWAEMLDAEAPLTDFHQQVPQMAFSWPFELDTFQKQAVLKLEQAESVFVAAHTSAGECSALHYYPLFYYPVSNLDTLVFIVNFEVIFEKQKLLGLMSVGMIRIIVKCKGMVVINISYQGKPWWPSTQLLCHRST